MTRKAAEAALQGIYGVALEPLGFRSHSGLRFQRAAGSSFQRVTFATRADRIGRLRYSVSAAICFPQMQALLDPEDGTSSTIGTPLHLLRPDRTYSEWEAEGVADMKRDEQAVVEAIKKWALPFLETYSDLGNVKRSLESDEPRDWFVLDPEARAATLVAIDCVQGHRTAALSRLDRVLKELATAPSKKRYPLELLRERILSVNAH